MKNRIIYDVFVVPLSMQKIIWTIGIVLVISVGIYFLVKSNSDTIVVQVPEVPVKVVPTDVSPEVKEEPLVVPAVVDQTKTVIGKSTEGRNITAYHYGSGEKEILFIGGIHGGYEWNTALVAYEMMDYYEKNVQVIPSNIKVTVIPVLNPDGLAKVVGTDGRFTKADIPTESKETIPGRFNANNVDLNRNFDCDWQAVGKWQDTNVSGGSKVFSELESQAIQKYQSTHSLSAVVVWYSAAGGVYASNCHTEVTKETLALTNLYAKASGYPAHESFDFYATTGDMVNWFAKKNIPAISVLLTNHTDTEWSKNKAGIDAVLNYIAE